MTDINIDEYLEDLQTYLDNGEEEKMYWQEDMQVLISELKETRKQLERLRNKNKDLLRKLRNRVKEIKKLTKYSLYKKEFSRLNKEIEKKDKIIDLMVPRVYLTEQEREEMERYIYASNKPKDFFKFCKTIL